MLSSATLFHFTRSFETLKKIIGGGFKPFYSSEDLKMFGVLECPGIPMVSFCDIPLSQASKHVGDYGRYGIGLHKKWGMAKNISPVHYIYEGSMCARVISGIYKDLPKDAFDIDCSCVRFDTKTAIFFYGKPYRGHLLRKDTTTEKIVDKGEVNFYDEREWRYVPFADQTLEGMEQIPPEVPAMLSASKYANPKILGDATMSLHKHYSLTFGAEDTKYLIVDNEDEIPELVDFIYGVQGRGENRELRSCPQDDRKRLTTRVISMRQIQEDF